MCWLFFCESPLLFSGDLLVFGYIRVRCHMWRVCSAGYKRVRLLGFFTYTASCVGGDAGMN